MLFSKVNKNLFPILHAMLLFGPDSNVAYRNSKFPKIGVTLPDKRCFYRFIMLVMEECYHLELSSRSYHSEKANFRLVLLIKKC